MGLYEYKCEDCHKVQELFYKMNDKRPSSIKCDECNGVAIRIFTTGAAYIKNEYVGDIWDKEGVDPQNNDPLKMKQANAARIKAMRKQNKN